jgi:hypothetical protein
MSTHALFLVRMDVAHDHETAFNEVYDGEHVPNLRGVPGVRRAARYRQPSPVYSRSWPPTSWTGSTCSTARRGRRQARRDDGRARSGPTR